MLNQFIKGHCIATTQYCAISAGERWFTLCKWEETPETHTDKSADNSQRKPNY